VTTYALPVYAAAAPCASNALGRIKFLFPNPFDVYLHDTPSRELFHASVPCLQFMVVSAWKNRWN